MPQALLIGNDINNATSDYSWEDLIDDLMGFAQVQDLDIRKDNKPFPLLYEEIFLNSANRTGIKEIDLKKYIARQTKNLWANVIHEQILGLNIPDIFTTNYDKTFERLLNTSKVENKGVVQESRYNVFRRFNLPSHQFWHIHGTLYTPNSITLGYEQYSGYLQIMRTYVTRGLTGQYKGVKFKALIRRIKQKDIKHDSWIDYFFTHDVFILGLNLDFVEMHLWWLITYRARLMLKDSELEITNKIYYIYPSIYEKASRSKLELFQANQVQTIPVRMSDRNHRIPYYKNVIRRIEELS